MAIQGALGVRLIDYPSGSTIGTAGRSPSGQDDFTADGAARLIHATVDTAAFATISLRQGWADATSSDRPSQGADHVDNIVITAGNGYHLLHVLSSTLGGRLVLYLWLDRVLGNLAMTQRSLRSISAQLAEHGH